MKFASFVLLLLGASAAAGEVGVRFVPESLPPVRAGDTAFVAVALRVESEERSEVSVSLRAPQEVAVVPEKAVVRLRPGADVPVFFKLVFSRDTDAPLTIKAAIDSEEAAELTVGERYDLSAVKWRSKTVKGDADIPADWTAASFDDSDWADRSIPFMWNQPGFLLLRARLFVPESWRGRQVRLRIAAADDRDVCYINGVEIGRTDGWDRQRDYAVDTGTLKYGEENVLCVAIENIAHGGGIYRSPNLFGVLDPIRAPEPRASRLAPPGKTGNPLPLRRMKVTGGVLHYEDGGEVALWGVNYYPQSWHQYVNMKRLGVDIKQAIRDDLDDMLKIGVQIIRIHVFDREISDADGNIIDNEHLDLLDYLVSEGAARGIYFMFTPIAWWFSPNQNPESFSAKTPKEYMFCDDGAMEAQAAYLKNWLNRTNRYTGRAYKDEPAVCVLEIMNEPAYVDYNSLSTPGASYYPNEAHLTEPFRKRLETKWLSWCERYGAEPQRAFFPLFRYELMSTYLDRMYEAIRSTGAKQPVACALFDTTGQDDLISAIADSKCEAVTTGSYAGAWDIPGDRVNYLPYTANESLDPRLDSKARLIYEFDGIKTLDSYLYPAYARKFRNMGAQICCMFQYDSRSTAEWNTDWDAHYLNLLYTPAKAVSFWIGGQVFSELERGAVFPDSGDPQLFGHCAVSFERNISIYASDDIYACSAPYGGWEPITHPQRPRFIIAVGDTPYTKYAGSGIYALEIDYDNRTGRLTVNPDAEVVGDPWKPDPGKSAVVLRNRPRQFVFAIEGIQLSSVSRTGESDAERPETEPEDNGFNVSAGEYVLRW